MRIRTFSPGDHDAAHRLWAAADGMEPPSRAEVERKLERDPDLFLVAEDGAGDLVGVVMGTYDGRRGWIFRLAVDPARQRNGVGRALVDELERRFVAMGVHDIRLLTVVGNTAARRFWETAGYAPFEDVVLYSRTLGDGPAGASC